MAKLTFMFLFIPLFLGAQNNQGIRFEKGLTWNDIKLKAQSTGKFIFVECYASWCGPCKKMEKEVYLKEEVGRRLNANFISIKFQLDTSKADDEEVKNKYLDAHNLKVQYKINSIPTFLFFTPNGELIHEDIGGKTMAEFIDVAEAALDSSKQYFILVKKFEEGDIDKNVLLALSQKTLQLDDKPLALKMARSYMIQVLNKLPNDSFYKKENIEFVRTYLDMVNSADRVFKLCYSNPTVIDSVVRMRVARSITDYVISKEEIRPIVETGYKNNVTPNWRKMFNAIKRKYGSYNAGRLVLDSKIDFFEHQKEWKSYTKCIVERVERFAIQELVPGIGGAYYLNDQAWPIFRYSDNKRELEKAISWSNMAIKFDSTSFNTPNVMDTKANLLYKLGRVEEAIALEQNAIALSPTNKGLKENFEKMKENKPTW